MNIESALKSHITDYIPLVGDDKDGENKIPVMHVKLIYGDPYPTQQPFSVVYIHSLIPWLRLLDRRELELVGHDLLSYRFVE